MMRQEAPWPKALEQVVGEITYKAGWRVRLIDRSRSESSRGLTLDIIAPTIDSYGDGIQTRTTRHEFIVPAAEYDERAWTRWVFERFVDVETHECMEFFKLRGLRPFAPHHGDGRNPYSIIERGSTADARKHPGDA